MLRLIEKGLMFGNLLEVSTPALVDRYNRALEHLTGKTTKLTDFHIDISGFSPEIGDELGDENYLNPEGCNRQFILMSPDQARAPLLNAWFSTSRDIIKSFILANEAQIFALTTQDAIAGELMNSVYRLRTPEQLFDIRKITIEADTTTGTLSVAQDLRKLVDRFMQEEDAWWDDLLIAQMITLGNQTGDITRAPLVFSKTEYTKGNYHTRHFGGVYVFRDLDHPGSIFTDITQVEEDLPGEVIPLANANQVAQFLARNGLVETVVEARDLDAASLIRQRLDFILIDHAARKGETLASPSRLDMRKLARRHLRSLPEAFHALTELLRWVEQGGRWPTIASDHPAYFYTLRAKQGPDRDLVNMLIAELSPLDVRQLFICHKAAFYDAYRQWDDSKREYVAEFLAQEYAIDKAGARNALFGAEPAMEETSRIPGPWG